MQQVESGAINAATGKKVFATMFESGKSAAEIIAGEGLAQIQDSGEIERLCREVVEKNPDNVAKYRAGNEGVFKFFVGQVMRASRGTGESADRERRTEATAGAGGRLSFEAARNGMTKVLKEGDPGAGVSAEGRRRQRNCLGGPARQAGGALFFPEGADPGLHHGSVVNFATRKSNSIMTGAVILGCSADSVQMQSKFREKQKLNFPLLSDPEFDAIEAYGARRMKLFLGKSFLGIVRSTFLSTGKGASPRFGIKFAPKAMPRKC